MRCLAALLVPLVALGWSRPATANWFHHGANPPPMLISASVAPESQRALPAATWIKLVAQAAGAGKIIPFAGGGSPTLDQCRTVAADYAITAAFMPAPHLPGLAQSIDRRYAVAQIEVMDCKSGARARPIVVRFESEPVAPQSADFSWARAIALTFSKHPLDLEPATARPSPVPRRQRPA